MYNTNTAFNIKRSTYNFKLYYLLLVSPFSIQLYSAFRVQRYALSIKLYFAFRIQL
jgi:hypothetical protein